MSGSAPNFVQKTDTSGITKPFVHGAISVTTSEVEAWVGTANFTGRKGIILTPTDGDIYWGNTGVTTSTGQLIAQGNTASIAVNDQVTIYLISAGTVDVRITEI